VELRFVALGFRGLYFGWSMDTVSVTCGGAVTFDVIDTQIHGSDAGLHLRVFAVLDYIILEIMEGFKNSVESGKGDESFMDEYEVQVMRHF